MYLESRERVYKVAANAVLPLLGELTAAPAPNPLAGFDRPLGSGEIEGRGKEGRGEGKEERDEKDGKIPPTNKFLIAVHRSHSV